MKENGRLDTATAKNKEHGAKNSEKLFVCITCGVKVPQADVTFGKQYTCPTCGGSLEEVI